MKKHNAVAKNYCWTYARDAWQQIVDSPKAGVLLLYY